jgi:hypothetical protein
MAISLERIDQASVFVVDPAWRRCFKLLAAWLLRQHASYNCRFSGKN